MIDTPSTDKIEPTPEGLDQERSTYPSSSSVPLGLTKPPIELCGMGARARGALISSLDRTFQQKKAPVQFALALLKYFSQLVRLIRSPFRLL